LTTNFCSIELQLSNENSTTIKPETSSCGDTNKEDKTTDFSALGNEIAIELKKKSAENQLQNVIKNPIKCPFIQIHLTFKLLGYDWKIAE
jgi:hypothetical protein